MKKITLVLFSIGFFQFSNAENHFSKHEIQKDIEEWSKEYLEKTCAIWNFQFNCLTRSSEIKNISLCLEQADDIQQNLDQKLDQKLIFIYDRRSVQVTQLYKDFLNLSQGDWAAQCLTSYSDKAFMIKYISVAEMLHYVFEQDMGFSFSKSTFFSGISLDQLFYLSSPKRLLKEISFNLATQNQAELEMPITMCVSPSYFVSKNEFSYRQELADEKPYKDLTKLCKNQNWDMEINCYKEATRSYLKLAQDNFCKDL